MIGIVLLRSISFGIFVLALGSFLAGFATPYWYKRHDVYNVELWHGLWKLCDEHWEFENGQLCYDLIPNKAYPDNTRLRTVQAMMVMSLICALVTLPLYVVWVSRSERWLGAQKSTKVGKATLSLCLTTGGFNALGVVIFGVNYSKYEEVLNWSFILAVVSGGLFVLNGLVCILLIQCCHVKPVKDVDPSQHKGSAGIPMAPARNVPPVAGNRSSRTDSSPMVAMDSIYEIEDDPSGLNDPGNRYSTGNIVLNRDREQDFHQNSIV